MSNPPNADLLMERYESYAFNTSAGCAIMIVIHCIQPDSEDIQATKNRHCNRNGTITSLQLASRRAHQDIVMQVGKPICQLTNHALPTNHKAHKASLHGCPAYQLITCSSQLTPNGVRQPITCCTSVPGLTQGQSIMNASLHGHL